MSRHLFYLLSVLCISISISITCAQAGGGLEFQTNCYFPVDAKESLRLQTGKGEFLKVNLPRMQFSEVYKHKGSHSLVFGTVTEKDNKSVFTVEASVTVPKHIRKAFLIFLPAPKNSKLRYSIRVLDASLSHFTPGSAVYYNFSQKTISGKLGERKLELKPKSSQMVKGVPGDRYYVDIRYLKGKNRRPLLKSWWEDDPDFRQVILIFDNPQTRRTRFLSISSRVSRAEEP